MNRDNYVSIWVGNCDSPQVLKEILKEGYTEDGDFIPSIFQMTFSIAYHDEDLRESHFYNQPSQSPETLLADFSYSDAIIPKLYGRIDEKFSEPVNTVILLYNFDYNGEKELVKLDDAEIRFVGSVAYRQV